MRGLKPKTLHHWGSSPVACGGLKPEYCQDACPGGEHVLPDPACPWIESPQAAGAEFGEPDVPLRVEDQFIGSARQRLEVAWLAGIRSRDPREGIALEMPRCRNVVSEGVGRLVGKPDRINRGDQHTRDAVLSTRRRQGVEELRARIEDDKRMQPHGSKPEPSQVVQSRTHRLALGSREGIHAEHSGRGVR